MWGMGWVRPRGRSPCSRSAAPPAQLWMMNNDSALTRLLVTGQVRSTLARNVPEGRRVSVRGLWAIALTGSQRNPDWPGYTETGELKDLGRAVQKRAARCSLLQGKTHADGGGWEGIKGKEDKN